MMRSSLSVILHVFLFFNLCKFIIDRKLYLYANVFQARIMFFSFYCLNTL